MSEKSGDSFRSDVLILTGNNQAGAARSYCYAGISTPIPITNPFQVSKYNIYYTITLAHFEKGSLEQHRKPHNED